MTTANRIDLGHGSIRMAPETVDGGLPTAGYGPRRGFPLLRELVARSAGAAPEEVALTAGASMALTAALACLTKPCSVLCPRPYYPVYPRLAELLGIEVIHYRLDPEQGWTPDFGGIQELIREDTRAILVNFPGNPTGSVPTAAQLSTLAQALQGRDILVISDEVYKDFIYDGGEHPDLSLLIPADSLVRIRSFSKRFQMAGERLGYFLSSPKLLQSISDAHWFLALSPPVTAQARVLAHLRDSPQQNLRRLLDALRRNRRTALEILSGCDRLVFDPPAGGIFFWLRVDDCPLDSARLAGALYRQTGVAVIPGIDFGVDGALLRASFAVPEAELVAGFRAMRLFLEEV